MHCKCSQRRPSIKITLLFCFFFFPFAHGDDQNTAILLQRKGEGHGQYSPPRPRRVLPASASGSSPPPPLPLRFPPAPVSAQRHVRSAQLTTTSGTTTSTKPETPLYNANGRTCEGLLDMDRSLHCGGEGEEWPEAVLCPSSLYLRVNCPVRCNS